MPVTFLLEIVLVQQLIIAFWEIGFGHILASESDWWSNEQFSAKYLSDEIKSKVNLAYCFVCLHSPQFQQLKRVIKNSLNNRDVDWTVPSTSFSVIQMLFRMDLSLRRKVFPWSIWWYCMPRRPPYKSIASCISVNGLSDKLFLVIEQITLHTVHSFFIMFGEKMEVFSIFIN